MVTHDAPYHGWQPDYPDRIAVLRKLYATLPTLECKGLCSSSCQTRIDMSLAERARIEAIRGKPIPEWMRDERGLPCPLLHNHRCSVYSVRPMVCRIWGTAAHPKFRCPHGCQPDRWLTDVDVITLLMDSYEAGGQPSGLIRVEDVRQLIQRPEVAALLARLLAGDESVFPELSAVLDPLLDE